ENGVIELYFVNMEYQLADIFTKALASERIEFVINKLGMQSFMPKTLKQLADEVIVLSEFAGLVIYEFAVPSVIRIRSVNVSSELATTSGVRIRSFVLCPNLQRAFNTNSQIVCMTKEQQQALEDALVPREQRLTIGSCNYRLSTTFKPKEPTFQVALDVLTLTPFYPAFLITASSPAVNMQEF
ncbi:hypothetical protein Tco_1415196, partial [Tanacetum coccineum]